MKKYCFVYYKEGCWLSKYLREERDKLKKKFKDRLNCCFNKYTKQYITKYKGIDYNDKPDLEFTNEAMEAFMIDIKLLLVSLA